MHRIDIIRTTVGIIGNIISALLFVSPAPTFWRICKKKSTEGFHPYPYLGSMMNCILWILVVHPVSTLAVTIINGFGLAMQIIFLGIFFTYTNKKYRRVIGLYLLGEIALAAVIVGVTSLLCFPTQHTGIRSLAVGIICDLFRVITYASPLSIVGKVVKTKSAEFLPVWLCLAGFCNCICWFSYAFIKKFDPYSAFANGIGALLGFIQLSVWLYYSTIWRCKKSVDSSCCKNKLD